MSSLIHCAASAVAETDDSRLEALPVGTAFVVVVERLCSAGTYFAENVTLLLAAFENRPPGTASAVRVTDEVAALGASLMAMHSA